MSWYLILYIFAALVIGATPTMRLMSSGRSVAALVYAVLILVVLILFGLRWFKYGSEVTRNAWPPIINACPDYLTFFNRPSATDPSGYTPSCVDFVGVSRNGALAKWRPEFSTDNPPTDDKYYFNVAVTGTTTAAKNQQLCSNAIATGLSWEGITNGESCFAPDLDVTSGASPTSLLQAGTPPIVVPRCSGSSDD